MKASALKEFLFDTFGHLSDAQLMALTIYGEARGEIYDGKVAVGSVILERVEHRDWDGKTVSEVCLMPYQFSCYLPDDPNFPALKLIAGDWDNKIMQSRKLRDCYKIASDLLAGQIRRTPEIAEHHATQYKTLQCRAAWADKIKKIAVIGRHEFYT
jgi:spore germination cell wall hydrolase CwlJ-like protein